MVIISETVAQMEQITFHVPQGMCHIISISLYVILVVCGFISNVMCGQLFCEVGTYQYIIPSVYVVTVGTYSDTLGRSVQCM